MIKKELENQRKNQQQLELKNEKTLRISKIKILERARGITLIALIITIIILIILAGITLVALSGENGILRQASKAKEETAKAEEKEKEDLKELEQQILLNTEVWNGTVGNSYAGGTGSKEDPYLIENGEQLAYLAEQVNNGEKYTGKYFKIIKSINLGGANWIPIGGIIEENITDLDDIENYFDGELDGQDNIIANLSITQNEQRPIGLVGMLGENGTVKNIKITSGNVAGEVYIGAIVGMSKGTIENCINNAEIESKGAYIGGIVGIAISGNISNCVNEGNIIEKGEEGKAVGGIVGQKTVEGIIENIYYYTESTIKGIGSESDEIGTKNPVEDIVGVTEKSRRKYRNI